MKYRIAILFIFLVGLFSTYYFFLREKNDIDYDTQDSISNLNPTELPLIDIKTISTDNAEINTKIIKSIPEVKILSNQISSDKANDYISRFVEDEESYFQKNLGEDLLKSSQEQNITNSFSLNSKVVSITPKLFNIKFDESFVLVHGSKPNNKIRYIIFDVENSKTLLFSDIISNDDIYKVIYDFVSSTKFSTEQVERSLKSNHLFSIEKDGLKIVIDIVENDNVNSEILIIPLDIISNHIQQDFINEITSEREFIRMSEPE